MRSALFVIDGGPGIGFGHLRRSGILLDAMTRAGFDCRILCPDVGAAAALGRTAAPMPVSLESLPPTDIVICDSYSIRAEQMRRIRDRCAALLVFDDMGDHPIEADLVLNHNLYGAAIDYAALTDAMVLTGPDCTLVDPSVLAARARRQSGAGDGIVISFGGTDDGTRAVELAMRLPAGSGGLCHIVVAPGITPSERAAAFAAQRSGQAMLHRGADLPVLLAEARLYLGGAGMTALEAAIVGLDMVLFVLVENQRLNAEAFARLGHAVLQGFDAERGAKQASAFLDRPFRQHASPVDGKGADRVVAAIEHLLETGWPA
jgi:spore coat polysaccharide biosynthesis predicted glycosyltransferase SpsG